MTRNLILATIGCSLLVLAALSFELGGGARAATSSVDVGDNWYCKPGDTACHTTDLNDIDVSTTINVGDTVVWNWVGSSYVQHTVTQCDETFATCSGPINSGYLMNPATYSYTFN